MGSILGAKDKAKSKKAITGSGLKIFAYVSMLIDHIGAVLIERYLDITGYNDAIRLPEESRPEIANMVFLDIMNIVDIVLRIIGRLAFPLFIFLLVQGFMHTKSKLKYAVRLLVFALIAEIPFDLAHSGNFISLGYQNVFFTLLLGFLFMCISEYIEKKDIDKRLFVPSLILSVGLTSAYLTRWIMRLFGLGFKGNDLVYDALIFSVFMCLCTFGLVFLMKKCSKEAFIKILAMIACLLVLMFIATFLKTDYSGMGVLAIAAAYAMRNDNIASMTATCIVLTIANLSEAFAFIDLKLIKRYNGERGLKLKYVFYLIYPVHFLIYYLIALALGLFGPPSLPKLF